MSLKITRPTVVSTDALHAVLRETRPSPTSRISILDRSRRRLFLMRRRVHADLAVRSRVP
jgi:hypothetical protein